MSQQATMKHKTSRVRVASMGRCGIVVQLVFMFLLVFSSAAAGLAGESKNTLKGKVTGTVVDAQTGDPLVGTNVFFEGTMIGTASDLDGNYTITNVPPGSYDLVLSMIGYVRDGSRLRSRARSASLSRIHPDPRVRALERTGVLHRRLRRRRQRSEEPQHGVDFPRGASAVVKRIEMNRDRVYPSWNLPVG